MLAQHKLTKQRHECMLKGLAFLHRYLALRRNSLSGSVALLGKKYSRSSSTGDTTAAAAVGSSGSTTTPIAPTAAEAALTSIERYELALYQETLYNLGRGFHDMRLLQLACAQYNQALELSRAFPFLCEEEYSVTRQAAHNLIQIYRRSGAKDLAFDVMNEYLTI